jgi:hypothetical protein
VSTAQLIVTLAFVGLLGAFHLVSRAARASAGTAPVTAARPAFRRGPLTALLVIAALVALGFVAAALVVSAADEDDDVTAPTQPTTTTMPPMPPPPPEPPRPALHAPTGTALVARVVTNAKAVVTTTRNRVGDRVRVVKRERGVYAVSVPGLSPARRRDAVIRAQPSDRADGVKVSARKVGPGMEFMVFSRDAQTGEFADAGFELAVFLPKQDLEATAADDDRGRPELPGTR